MPGFSPLVASPGFAGGRLLLFNQLLSAFHAYSQAPDSNPPTRPLLILNENLFGAMDLRFPVQNAHGDVVALDVPDHGKLGHGTHAAFVNALRDTVPLTAEVEGALAQCMPLPLQTPLEAAAIFWQKLFPKLDLEIIPRGKPGPDATLARTGIVWCSARHTHTIKELGLTPEQVLEGENACLKRLIPIPAGALGQCTEAFRATQEERLQQMRSLAEEVDPSLLGAWVRLRKNLRESLNDFAGRADRCGRNRGGIRRTRLHALAQAVRPHGAPQEEGLTLFSATASYQLAIDQPDRLITRFKGCSGAERLLRTD